MTATGHAGEWVWLARIRRPQGRRGEVFAEILTDFPDRFAQRPRLFLLSGEAVSESTAPPLNAELKAHWLHKGGIVLHFAGVDSISAAETLAGMIVAIPRAERAEIGPDEVYIGDLIGLTVIDMAANGPVTVGTIDNVDRTAGPVPLLIVQSAKGEVLIPFAKAYLRKIDVEGGRLEMALPEGLLDLNS